MAPSCTCPKDKREFPLTEQVTSHAYDCSRLVLSVECLRGTSLIRKRPPPSDLHRTIGIGVLKGPRGGPFLMSEVLLWCLLFSVEC